MSKVSEIITGSDLKHVEKAINLRKQNLVHLWTSQDFETFYQDYILTADKCKKLRSVIDSNKYCLIVDNDVNLTDDGKTTLIAQRVTIKKEDIKIRQQLTHCYAQIEADLIKGEVVIMTISKLANDALNNEIVRLNSCTQKVQHITNEKTN